jgi:hypothetical protein
MSVGCPLTVAHSTLAAGPVPVITVPLTLAALLTAAKSDMSISVAKTMLIVIRLCFIHSTFFDEVSEASERYTRTVVQLPHPPLL